MKHKERVVIVIGCVAILCYGVQAGEGKKREALKIEPSRSEPIEIERVNQKLLTSKEILRRAMIDLNCASYPHSPNSPDLEDVLARSKEVGFYENFYGNDALSLSDQQKR